MKLVPHRKFSITSVAALLLAVSMPAALSVSMAADSLQTQSESISADGIQGTLVIVGGGRVPEAATAAFIDALDDEGSVVVIGTAAENPQKAADSAADWLSEAGVAEQVLSHSQEQFMSEPAELAAAIARAGGVWITGGQQQRLAEAYQGTVVETELQQLLQRGGVIGGTSAGAAILSHRMIASGRTEPQMRTGLDLLPGAIIDQHFTQRSRLIRSRIAVSRYPDQFGMGIDEDTAVIVKGRSMRVVGSGAVTCLLAGCSYRQADELRLESGQYADLTQLRRAARERAVNLNPGVPQFGSPSLSHGALVIVGGGSLPPSVVQRFVDLAGGSSAHIVVLPTAVARDVARFQSVPGFLRDCGAETVTMLPQMLPDEVQSEEFQQALRRATGVWFGGGRQWNFVDAYEATNAVELFRDVLRRDGVIGGSSAGATIQGEFLVRGHPLGNTVMMAEGYERGFAFLPGTAIDQHFSQRRRQPDLIPVIQQHPKLLGIGIDEGTALVVQGSRAEVIGEHAAHFLTAERLSKISTEAAEKLSEPDTEPLYYTVPSGESVDLLELQDPVGRATD